ncbi:MAG: ABC transporter ATP-binding protein [Ruminococcaceae bacterium]|nr:ABC transporter ATP-binding protein [Oscillospiraceae bacterium]
MSILEIKNIHKVYGKDSHEVHALNDVSFNVDKGEFIAIVGTSGSGKSTLMHLIGGVDVPTSGNIIVDGQDIGIFTEKELTIYRRKKVSTIYQFYNLLPMLNVRDNITLPIELDGKKLDDKVLRDVLKTLGIEDKEFHYPGHLSGGQMQRVAIARALITNPVILLADEPTGNLDSRNTQEIMQLFRSSNEKYNQTIIIVTHDEQVANMADRIIQIEDGKIVKDTRNEYHS